MTRFGELSLHELVHRCDLLGEIGTLLETFRHEGDLGDGLEVRLHHSNRSEESLQIIGQVGSTCISGVHSNEDTGVLGNADGDLVDVTGLHVSLSEALQDDLDLRLNNRQYIKQDSVELIEATPCSSL